MSAAQQQRSKTSIRMINIHTNEIRYINYENIDNTDWLKYSPPKVNTGKIWYNDGDKEYLLLPELADTHLKRGRLKPSTIAL